MSLGRGRPWIRKIHGPQPLTGGWKSAVKAAELGGFFREVRRKLAALGRPGDGFCRLAGLAFLNALLKTWPPVARSRRQAGGRPDWAVFAPIRKFYSWKRKLRNRFGLGRVRGR